MWCFYLDHMGRVSGCHGNCDLEWHGQNTELLQRSVAPSGLTCGLLLEFPLFIRGLETLALPCIAKFDPQPLSYLGSLVDRTLV